MVGVALLAFNHVLPTLGVYLIGATVWKIARGYPIRRWFF
jgi:hypothetical protein